MGLKSAKRGGALVTTLVVATLAFLTAFILAGSSISHLGYTQRVSNQRRALNLAEAAVFRAAAELQGNPSYGTAQESFTFRFSGDPEDAEGGLSFDPASSAYSTYNLRNELAVPGFGGRTVPANAVHLVGVGRCLNVTRVVELVVHQPPFPFVLASSGPVHSDGGLLIGALEPGQGVIVDEQTLQPGHLASNSSQAQAIYLGPDSLVIGDIQSTGGLELDPGAEVRGEQRLFGDPVAIPRIDIRQFDPARAGDGYLRLGPSLSRGTLVGENRCGTNLTVVGDLNLDGASLFVEGDLVVYGGITGKGMVATTGSVRVEGGTALSSNNQSVFMAGGDVVLNGLDDMASSFQGLVYSEGSFTATNITVLGVFLTSGQDSRIHLRQSRLIHQPAYTRLDRAAPRTRFAFGLENDALEDGLASLRAGGQGGLASEMESSELEYLEDDDDLEDYSEVFYVEAESVQLADGTTAYNVYDPTTGAVHQSSTTQAAAADIRLVAQAYAISHIESFFVAEQEAGWTARSLVVTEGTDDLLEDLRELRPVEREQEVRLGREGSFDLNRFLGEGGNLRVLMWCQR